MVEVKKISQEKQDIPVQREAINARTGIKNPASIPENVHHSTQVKEYIPVGNQENGDSDGKTAEYRSSVLAEINRMSQEKRSIPKKEKDEKHQADELKHSIMIENTPFISKDSICQPDDPKHSFKSIYRDS